MNAKHTKLLLPLAALALASVACDPFPAAPGGDPAIVRVVTYGGSLGYTDSVEAPTGATWATDFAEPDGIVRVQFNKPMDDSSIQLYPQYNPNGTPFVPPAGADLCTPAANFNVSTFPAGTLVCSDPTSATDGGSAVIYPGAPLTYGTTYTVTGSVRDYQQKSLSINVSVTVNKRPLPAGVDGYTIGVDWFDSLATSYEVLWATTAAGPFTSLSIVDPLVDCDGVLCAVLHTERVPNTDYYYQVKETTGATTTTRPAASLPGTTLNPITPTLTTVLTTAVPPTTIPGVIRVVWGSTQGSNGYDVETSTDGTTWTLYSHHTATARSVYLGTPAPGTTVPTANGNLLSGTIYYVRVTPTFASGFVAQKGIVQSKAAP